MKLELRYGNHPEDMRRYDTGELRKHFLVERVFSPGELSLVYTHVDRVIFGGASPTLERIDLTGGK
jgi:4-deoxy-L-threo-5-hexosulose-uronate ketol-isomerase